MAALQSGKLPPLLWMLLGMAALCLVVEAVRQARGLEVDWKARCSGPWRCLRWRR